MISIEEYAKIVEITSNTISLTIFVIVGAWAIIKTIKMNEKVKNAIIEEKKRNV